MKTMLIDNDYSKRRINLGIHFVVAAERNLGNFVEVATRELPRLNTSAHMALKQLLILILSESSAELLARGKVPNLAKERPSVRTASQKADCPRDCARFYF